LPPNCPGNRDHLNRRKTKKLIYDRKSNAITEWYRVF